MLAAALDGRDKSQVATAAAIERSTLYAIPAGDTWPDSVTLIRLVDVLGRTLWPSTPVPPLSRFDSTA